jgi:hypothetical protein
MSQTRLTTEKVLTETYGAVMSGVELRKALGFKSVSAFHRAVAAGNVQVGFFRMPGRRGRFALASDVAAWLHEVKAAGWKSDPRPGTGTQSVRRRMPQAGKVQTTQPKTALVRTLPTRKKGGTKM